MSAIIYRLTNTVNQKIYIGLTTKTLDERWVGHIAHANQGSPFHLHRAIRKYGPDAFTREVLEETTTDLMNEREIHWIAECSPEYNMTTGGEGILGLSHTPETRAKMSAARRGKPKSPETRAKMSAAKLGKNNPHYRKTLSPETRAKMSAAHRGKTFSPQTREKISAAARNMSPEHREKISAANRGKKRSLEARAKMSAAAKRRRVISPRENAIRVDTARSI